MNISDYKRASQILSATAEAIRFVRLGLHGDANRMYPTSVAVRIETAIEFLNEIKHL